MQVTLASTFDNNSISLHFEYGGKCVLEVSGNKIIIVITLSDPT